MSSRRRDFRCPAEGGGSEACCGTERWAGGGQAAQGLPPGLRGAAAAGWGGPEAAQARAPRVRGRAREGGRATRGSCPAASLAAAERRRGAGRGPQNPLATRARVLGELLLPGTPSWTSPPKGNVSGRPAEGASG